MAEKIGISGGEKLESYLRKLARKVSKETTMRAGFLEGATDPKSGLPEGAIAAMNEFGTKNSPPRPFMRGTVKKHSGEWGEQLGKLLVATDYDANASLRQMGALIVGQIQLSIRDFKDPGNAPSTIAKKGFDKPLIEIGHMLNSVASDVK